MSNFDWQSINQNFQGHKKLEDGRILISKVKLEDIEVDPNQPRFNAKNADVESLARTIEEVGVIHPILCIRKGKKKYQIVSGERRYWALKHAGRTTTDILLLEDPKKGTMIQLIENLSRQNLNPLEEAKAMKGLLGHYKFKKKDLAKKLGKSNAFITRSLNVLKIKDEVCTAMVLSPQKISKEVFWIMGELDPAIQEKVWKKISSHPTIGNIKKVKEQMEITPLARKQKKNKTVAYQPKKTKWVREISFLRKPSTPKDIDEIIAELISLKAKLKREMVKK